VEGTNKAHENGEAMGFVDVRLTVMLGQGYWILVLHFMCETALGRVAELLCIPNCFCISILVRQLTFRFIN
jgi:hypothetical protein